MNVGRPVRDWEALKSEWLQSKETMNKFRMRHGIDQALFYRTTKRLGWKKEKQKLDKNALQKITNRLVNERVKDWTQYRSAQNGLMESVQDIIQRTRNASGKITRSMKTSDVRQLASALKDLTQNQSFMDGGPTERSESKNLHMEMVRIVQEIKDDV